MTNDLLNRALGKATHGNRNETGFWLACQLRDNGYTETEAEGIMLEYASQVSRNGIKPYTRTEVLESLKSAFSNTPRAQGIGGDTNMGKGVRPVKKPTKHAKKRETTTT